MPTFLQPSRHTLIEYAIVGAILIVLGALAMVTMGKPSHPRCRALAGDSLSRFEECVRREQMAE